MKSLLEKWNHFWFEPATPDNLGLARIFLYGSMAIYYLLTPSLFPIWGWQATFSDWGNVDPVFWNPISIFRIFHLPQFSSQIIFIMEMGCNSSLMLSAIGLFTRLSTFTSLFLGVYLLGLGNNFGKTHHHEILLLWLFFIMFVSRCGDSWSVDQFLRTGRSAQKTSVHSSEFTWPIRLIWVVMAMIYFAAGVSKLRHSGGEWVSGNVMSFYLLQAQYHVANSAPLSNWGPYIGSHPMWCHVLALMALILELSYPLALFSRRLRWIIFPSGMLMQFSISLLMGPTFYQMMICQILWMPLDRIVNSVLKTRTSDRSICAHPATMIGPASAPRDMDQI
jgi:hypothetical protein